MLLENLSLAGLPHGPGLRLDDGLRERAVVREEDRRVAHVHTAQPGLEAVPHRPRQGPSSRNEVPGLPHVLLFRSS